MPVQQFSPPGYAQPRDLDFSSLAQLPQVYRQAQDQATVRDTLATLGQGGQVDPMRLIQSGNLTLANLGFNQLQRQQEQQRQAQQDQRQLSRDSVEDKFRAQQLGQTAQYQNAQLELQRRSADRADDPTPKGWLKDDTAPGGYRPIGPNDPAYVARLEEDKARARGNVPQAVYPGAEFVVPNKAAEGPLYRVPQATSTGGGLTQDALDIRAEQWNNGDYEGATKNVGRGAQGGATLEAISNRAAAKLIEQGKTPQEAAALTSANMQKFRASGIGQSTEARTGASREANLNIILKAADAAIPAALEASEKVSRTGWVPLNQIIQKGQVMASNPELRQFGMANLQLAEHWARAMNPTGVMRESDRDMALHFLSLADSKETYKQAVSQLKLQITRERDAIRSAMPGHGSPAPSAAPAPVVVDGYTIKQN